MTPSEIERIYHLIAENSGDVIWVLNLESLSFTYVSPSVFHLRGYTPEEVLKQHMTEVMTEESANFIVQNLPERFERFYKGDPEMRIMTHEVDQLHRNGSIIPTEVVTSLITNDEGVITDVLGISRNITERKKIERQIQEKEKLLQQQNDQLIIARDKAEESDRLKTIFLQNMSHEIRTPMNAIMGFSDLLISTFNNKSKLEYYARIIRQRGSDLLDLINDMLDLSKIEAGQQVLNPENVNMEELLKELGDFFEEYNKSKGKNSVALIFKPFENLTGSEVIIDKGKLKQVFINLINNALKFTNCGKIEVGCSFCHPDLIHCYVSDTGIGIPEEQQKKIFDRFLQINNTTNNPQGGTGLGLAIVKGLVELMGGEVTVTSTPGIGSNFSFTVKNNQMGRSTKVKTKSRGSVMADKFPLGKTILIVEDDIYSAAYLLEILAETPIKTFHVAFGSEAISFVQQNRTDIILMDLRLPEIDGFELTRIIKRENPDIKIIAQTAYATEEDQNKAIEAGCDDFLAKPVVKDELLCKLFAYLNA